VGLRETTTPFAVGLPSSDPKWPATNGGRRGTCVNLAPSTSPNRSSVQRDDIEICVRTGGAFSEALLRLSSVKRLNSHGRMATTRVVPSRLS
jgi:hypothetical protein